MRPVSPRFLNTIRGSHAMASRVRVVPAGFTGTNPGPLTATGAPVDEILITTGDVKFDATADIRATVDIATMAEFPTDASSLLAPYGNELYVERGVVYGDGSTEWVGQGYYRIYSTDQDNAPDGEVVVAGRDRMSGIIDAKREAPFSFGEGTSVSAAFDFLVGEVYPTAVIEYDFDAGATLFTTTHIVDEDRYAFLKGIADSLGKVMFFDYAGRLQLVSAPNPTVSVFSVNHGDQGVVLKVSRSLNREGAFNAFVVIGDQVGEAEPVRAASYDLNPASPTYWNGPFGKVPSKVTSTFVSTQQQAQDAADAMLARSIGVPYSVDFTAVPNSALEPLDSVTVSYSDTHRREIHIIETLTIPLDAETAMSGTTRQQYFRGGGVL
jgi:hypothetical protein